MSKEKLLLLRRAYLACRPLAEIVKILDSFKRQANIPSEKDLVTVVLRNNVSQKYPAHSQYSLAVIKLLIAFVDEHFPPVGDLLYDALADTVASCGSESTFVNYEIGDRDELECITLSENRAFVSEGSTGFRSWPASKVLAEALLNEDVDNRRIVELGSGVGLTGLVMLKKRPNVASYTFTDCHPGVLGNVQMNLGLNFDPANAKATVQLLDWCVGGTIEADLVVGADIVFDEAVFPALVNLITDTVERQPCEVIISSVIRNEATYRAFYDRVTERLDAQTIPLKRFKYFEQPSDKYEILKLTKKRLLS